jgi:hypothetical protein
MTAEQPADDFGNNVVNSIFELFVMPEIVRRGLALERHEVRKVVVELNPDRKHPVVRINEAAQIVAQVRVTRDLAEGEEVTVEDIDEVHSVEPANVGPNSGYMCFADIGGRQCIKFDFRYHRERVVELLLRAQDFLDAASDSVDRRPAVACDLAFSAAELTVQAQMLIGQEKTKSHWQRQEWLDSWVAHNNAPLEHADALRKLREYRLVGRYGDVPPISNRTNLEDLFAVVKHMIHSAKNYAGEPPQLIDESRTRAASLDSPGQG